MTIPSMDQYALNDPAFECRNHSITPSVTIEYKEHKMLQSLFEAARQFTTSPGGPGDRFLLRATVKRVEDFYNGKG